MLAEPGLGTWDPSMYTDMYIYILDQYVAMGHNHHALLRDCRDTGAVCGNDNFVIECDGAVRTRGNAKGQLVNCVNRHCITWRLHKTDSVSGHASDL